jgi:hypothetical protein
MHVNNPSPVNPLLGLHNFTHVSAPPAPTISTPVMSSMPLCDTSKHFGKLLPDPWGGQVGECVSYVKVKHPVIFELNTKQICLFLRYALVTTVKQHCGERVTKSKATQI